MRTALVTGLCLLPVLTACYGPRYSPDGGSTSSSSSTGSTGSGASASSASSSSGSSGAGGSSNGAGGAGGGAVAGTGGAGGGAPACSDPKAGVGWAGDWGQVTTHACTHSLGLGDPVLFDLSNYGHDCQQVTADVWVPGITDVDGDPAGIRAEVVTDLGNAGQVKASALMFSGRVGNNYRYVWSPYLPVVPEGAYTFSFRFSAGQGNVGCWYRIGLGDGPAGGADRGATVAP